MRSSPPKTKKPSTKSGKSNSKSKSNTRSSTSKMCTKNWSSHNKAASRSTSPWQCKNKETNVAEKEPGTDLPHESPVMNVDGTEPGTPLVSNVPTKTKKKKHTKKDSTIESNED
jgi:hypothetical protein